MNESGDPPGEASWAKDRRSRESDSLRLAGGSESGEGGDGFWMFAFAFVGWARGAGDGGRDWGSA